MGLKDMRSYAAPLAAAVLAGALASACASASSGPAAAGASHQPGIPTGGPSAAPTSSPASAPPPTAAPAGAATSAILDYVAPAGNPAPAVHKTVVGATFQRLAADLAALTPLPQGSATCNVVNGESGTITIAAAGHTRVFVVDGSPCRGVRLTVDGTAQPTLAGSVVLLEQVRAIAGTSGMAHPLGAG